MRKKYDLYISFGAVCSCSTILRDSRLQFWSYPFDWIGGADVVYRANLVKNDFEGWLNAEDFRFIGTREHPEPKNIFFNDKTRIVYNHDFKINTPLEDCIDDVREKYNRRIKRMNELINKADNVLFVYVDTPEVKSQIEYEKMEQALDILSQKYPNTNLNFLYFYCAKDIPFKSRKITKLSNRITKIGFNYDKCNPENIQEVDLYNLLKLFSKFKRIIY